MHIYKFILTKTFFLHKVGQSSGFLVAYREEICMPFTSATIKLQSGETVFYSFAPLFNILIIYATLQGSVLGTKKRVVNKA